MNAERFILCYTFFGLALSPAFLQPLATRAIRVVSFQKEKINPSDPAELTDGIFYLIGADCTDSSAFVCRDNLAIRLIFKGEIDGQTGDELSQSYEN